MSLMATNHRCPLKKRSAPPTLRTCQRGQKQLWCPCGRHVLTLKKNTANTTQAGCLAKRRVTRRLPHTVSELSVTRKSIKNSIETFFTSALNTLGGTRKKTRQQRGQLNRKRDNSGKQADKHKLTGVMNASGGETLTVVRRGLRHPGGTVTRNTGAHSSSFSGASCVGGACPVGGNDWRWIRPITIKRQTERGGNCVWAEAI